jgi:hypothetical protein
VLRGDSGRIPQLVVERERRPHLPKSVLHSRILSMLRDIEASSGRSGCRELLPTRIPVLRLRSAGVEVLGLVGLLLDLSEQAVV